MSQTLYQYAQTLSKNRFAFIDIDGTLTVNPWETKEKDFLDPNLTNQAIKDLQDKGFMCILSTSRTAEMCMTEECYSLTKNLHGFHRPPPHMGRREDGSRFYRSPGEVFPLKMLDQPIIISESGTCISVLQNDGGYAIDRSFHGESFPSSSQWKKEVESFLSTLSTPYSHASIDSEEAYMRGETDIFPADYRAQLSFPTQKDMQDLAKKVREKEGLCFTNDSNPDLGTFMGYVTPNRGKTDAVNHVLKNLQEQSAEVLIVGDSFPDLQAGLNVQAENGTRIAFFLVGGSRLFSYLSEAERVTFAGDDLTEFKKLILNPTELRKIELGDRLFPGSVGPRSIVEFLTQKSYNRS